MAGADSAVEAAGNLKGWQRHFNAVTIKGRRNVCFHGFCEDFHVL